MKAFQASRVIVPMLTPFTEGGRAVDEGALRALSQWLIDRGVSGLMPCGTTGEGLLLSTEERKRVLELTSEAAQGRVPIMAHVGAISTMETIELARHARDCGADAVSVVAPFYYATSEALMVEHFCRVAEAVPDTPVLLYNIPQCTINNITPALAREVLSRCANVIGIKDSSGNLEALEEFIALRDGQFQVLNGNDAVLVRALRLGACGGVSGNANVIPEIVCGVVNVWEDGDEVGAARFFARLGQVRELLGGSFWLMKHALGLRGVAAGAVRPPQGPPAKEAIERVDAELLGLLGD